MTRTEHFDGAMRPRILPPEKFTRRCRATLPFIQNRQRQEIQKRNIEDRRRLVGRQKVSGQNAKKCVARSSILPSCYYYRRPTLLINPNHLEVQASCARRIPTSALCAMVLASRDLGAQSELFHMCSIASGKRTAKSTNLRVDFIFL
jgi:hypothetical protein